MLSKILAAMSLKAIRNVLYLFSLPPEHLRASLVLLMCLAILNDLVRTAFMVQWTRSRVVHFVVDVLTLWPGIWLGAVLIYAASRHPERTWINLSCVAVLYVGWWLGGTLTRLSRLDTEGSDICWMSHGAIITLVCWLASLVIF
jgi:hypothetical protein